MHIDVLTLRQIDTGHMKALSDMVDPRCSQRQFTGDRLTLLFTSTVRDRSIERCDTGSHLFDNTGQFGRNTLPGIDGTSEHGPAIGVAAVGASVV